MKKKIKKNHKIFQNDNWEIRSIHEKDVSRSVIKVTAHSQSACRDLSSR